MKAIKKAYEALKGDLNNTRSLMPEDEFLFFDTRSEYYICADEIGFFNGTYKTYICTVEQFNNYKSVAVPTFTQEMCDAGTLPSVGMACLIRHLIWDKTNYEHVEVLALTKEYLLVQIKGQPCENHFHLRDIQFKPLTPPIELIDGNWYLVKKGWGSKEVRALYRNEGKWFYDVSNYPDEAEGEHNVISKLLEVKS